MPNVLTPELTPAEALWLWRRSHGLNQAAAAVRLGCGRGLVSAVERGVGQPRPGWRLGVAPATPSLRLALARRRSGYTLDRLAARLGVSRPTLLAMERRGDPALTKFWQGFTFAR